MTVRSDLQQSAFAALQEMRGEGGVDSTAPRSISASRIVAYARRENTVSDLTIERALKEQPGLRRLYLSALSRSAIASSPLAAAASEAKLTERFVGEYQIEIFEEEEGPPWLVVRIPEDAVEVSTMELRRPDGTGQRLNLGQPVDGVLQLPLDPDFEELVDVLELLNDPMTAIHLI